MIVSLIAAMADNRVIGRDNRLPWDLPAERRRYRDITMGHPIIMGRRTYQSIGRALTGRTTIVLTRDPGFFAEGCVVVHSFAEALAAASGTEEVFVSGGAEVYAAALPVAERIYLTVIHHEFAGDTFFPAVPSSFRVVSSEEFEDAGVPYTCYLFEREKNRIDD